MIVLVDADSLVYSCSWGVETLDEAKDKFDQHLMKIVNDLEEHGEVEKCVVYHGGTNKPRKAIDPSYKANRKSEKPEFYQQLSHYVKEKWKSIDAKDEETDDLVAKDKAAWESLGYRVVIASIDKDYRQLPGVIYTWNSKNPGVFYVSEEEAEYNFWLQMLTGDPADNVKGVPRIGKVKGSKILDNAKNPLCRVYRRYVEAYGEDARQKFKDTYKLLKIGI